ncbi:MAG: hypothetical protein ABIE74_00370 [Pseudomonadota bacterium]
MNTKRNWLAIIIGVLLIPTFPITYHIYLKTGCARPYLYEAVCGDGAKLVIGIYAFAAIFGLYLIITGIKRKDNNEKK